MYERKIPEDLDCGINVTMKVLSGKWKPCIIDSIHRGIRRPVELHAAIAAAAPRVINMQLRELEEFSIVTKKVYPESVPLKVEYYLTPLGESIMPVIRSIEKWGDDNKDHVAGVCERTEGALRRPEAVCR
ncbi:helix-turn-helix domain-containing protein [Chitinophaga sp. YIM B06452]|uniref:winged helix-turn-helix transcriptional regulator n=1 Tax=Chitinophaga sp. YIM B06452 TaxID=3082158 RepID=UPI0031FE5405